MIICKTQRELETMKKAGALANEAQEIIARAIKPGVTTKELDSLAEDFIRSHGAIPAFKGYRGFPATVCVAINEEVVHGIPGSRVLQEGDIISLDVGTILQGYYGDCARTVPVGEVTEEARNLINVTAQSLVEGIKEARLGNRLSDISHAIQTYVESNGYSVVRDYVGHGIGQAMHEAPQIPNFGPAGRGPLLKEGMTLAIEPMVNVGGYGVKTRSDGWTVVTQDGSLSAHFEDTVAITREGALILTRP